MARFNENAIETKGVIVFSGYLTLRPDTTPKFTANAPKLLAGERSMYLSVSVPAAHFKAPQLSARISIPETYASEFSVDVAAAENALSSALGVDVVVSLKTGE